MNKKIFAILIVLICALSISAVSAADDSAASDVATIADPVPAGTFEDLGTALDGQSSVVLTKNYTNVGNESAIEIQNTVSIDGNNTIIDANNTSSVFEIAEGATVTINNLTFINGNSTLGAAIINYGTLNLINCSFDDNTIQGIGGVIYNDGTLNIENCTFAGTGPGVFNEVGKTATINGTTVDVTTNTSVSVDTIDDVEYGNNVTVTGTIIPDNITDAKVEIILNENPAVEATIVNDTYSYVFEKLAAGEYNVTINYIPGTGYENSAVVTKFNVTKKETTIESELNKTDITYPEDVVINVTTNLPKDTKVNVTIWDYDLNIIATQNVTVDENGTAQATFTGIDAGDYGFTANYTGNENYTDGYDGGSFTVTMVQTDMNITADATVSVGDKVTINGTTANMPTDAKINVIVYNESNDIVFTENITLTSGNFTVDVEDLGVGNYTIVANYTGNGNYAAIEKTTTVEVTIITTDMDIAASDITVGDDLEIEGNTSGIKDGEKVNITITKDGVEVYNTTEEVNFDKFTAIISDLAVGNYTVEVTYEGDENHTAITKEIEVTVSKIETEITLDSITDIKVGDDLTVAGTTNLPEDTNVTIKVIAEDGTVVNETVAQVDDSNAFTVDIKNLVAGKYNVTATYAGNENYTAAADNATVAVSKIETSINTLTAPDVNVGTNVTVSGTVIGIPENGNITFTIDGVKVGNATVDDQDKFTTEIELEAGNYTIVATYEDATGMYETATKNVTVIVSKYGVTITPDADKIKQANETNVTIKGQIAVDPDEATVLAELENKTVTITVDGRAPVTGKINATGGFEANLGNFTDDGVYNATIKFEETPKFEAANATVIITIGKYPVTIIIDDINGTLGENVTVNGTVDVSAGNIADIAGENVTIVIGDKEINATIEADGTFSANVGNFTTTTPVDYTVKFNGAENYTATTASATIYVKNITSITVANVTTQVGEAVTINGTITGVTEGKVIITVNGTEYEAEINATGGFKVTIPAFVAGNKTYNYTVTYAGSTVAHPSNATANITVYKNNTTITVENYTIVYGNNVTIEGNANDLIGANVTVVVGTDEYNTTVGADGKFSVDVETDSLDVGEHEYKVIFAGNDFYNATETTAVINITKRNVTTTINKINGIDTEDVIVNGTTSPLLKDETVTVYIDGASVGNGLVDENGTFSINIGQLEGGVYNYTVIIDATTNVNKVNVSEEIIILNTTSMAADNVSAKVGDDINVTIATTGFANNTKINVTVNGEDKEVTIVDDEIILSLGAATEAGVTNYTVEFAGNEYYAASEVNFTVNVTKYNTSIEVNDTIIDFGENVNITIKTVNITNGTSISIVIDGIGSYTKEVMNNTAVVELTKPNAGEYNITVTYPGDNKYAASTANATLTVNKVVTAIEVNSTVTKIDLGNNLIVSGNTTNITNNSEIVITVEDIDGNHTFTTTVVDGKFSTNIGNATAEGTAKVTVSFAGDQNYAPCNDTYSVTIGRDTPTFNVEANASDVLENVTINGTLLDKDGNALADQNITIVFNGNETNTTTDANGKFSVDLGKLPVGDYTAEVTFEGNDDYRDVTKEVEFTVTLVKTNITVSNMTVIAGANFTVNGNVSNIPENKTIVVEINGVEKEVNVTADGKFSAEFETLPGNQNYTINVSFAGDETYAAASASATLTVDKINTTISIENFTFYVDDENVTINGTTTGIPDNATVTVIIGNGKRVVNVTDGKFSLNITNMPIAGVYNITVSYEGNDYYNAATNSSTLTVNKYATNTTISVDSIIEAGDNLTINVTVTANGDNVTNGKVSLTINGKDYGTADVVNGTASFTIEKLTAGNKTVVVKYLGTDYYNASENTTKVLVNGTALELNVPSIVKYYKNGTQLIVYVTSNGANVTGENVTIIINGVKYTKPVTDGIAKMSINLGPGIYNVTVLFESQTYNPANATATVEVLSIIEGNNLVKYFKNGSQFTVKILDDHGNAVGAGEAVRFNINGVIYTKYTNANGEATLNINLRPGDYIITVTATATKKEQKGFNITVLSPIISSNLVKYYKNGSQFTVKVLDGQGNAVGAGEAVTFNINGVIYTKYTNANGEATLNINLAAGNSISNEYVITVTARGLSTSNTITVLPVITAENYDITEKPAKFYVTVTDGQGNPQSGVEVSYNINGKIYYRTSDADGLAGLDIRLGYGEYIITSTRLDNKAVISNKIRVLV